MKTIDVSVVIGGHDVSDCVTGLEHHHSICEVMATGNVYLEQAAAPEIEPYDTIVIHEQGVKTFTGYVVAVRYERLPYSITVEFADPVIKLQDCWTTEVYTTHDETVRYWIEFFCDIAGVDYYFDTNLAVGIAGFVPKDNTFEYSSCLDLIKRLTDINGYWMYSTPDGVIHFSQGHPVAVTLDFSTGDDVFDFRREQSITKTRNRAVVLGKYPISADASVDGPAELDYEKTSVVASPYVTNAQQLANRLVRAFARVEDKKILEIDGDPNVTLAQFAHIYDSWSGLHRNSQVTSFDTSITDRLYTQRVILDEECPRVWTYVGLSQPRLAAFNYGTGAHLLSVDNSWADRNDGLQGADILDNHGVVDNVHSSGEYDLDMWTTVYEHVYRTTDSGDNYTTTMPSGSLDNSWFDVSPPEASGCNFLQTMPSAYDTEKNYILAQYQEQDTGNQLYRGYLFVASGVSDIITWSGVSLGGYSVNPLNADELFASRHVNTDAYADSVSWGATTHAHVASSQEYRVAGKPDDSGLYMQYFYDNENGSCVIAVDVDLGFMISPKYGETTIAARTRGGTGNPSYTIFDGGYPSIYVSSDGSSWTIINNQTWWNNGANYDWGPEMSMNSYPDFRFIRFKWEPAWAAGVGYADESDGYFDAVRVRGISAREFGRTVKPIWMDEDPDYVWLTIWKVGEVKEELPSVGYNKLMDYELTGENYISFWTEFIPGIGGNQHTAYDEGHSPTNSIYFDLSVGAKVNYGTSEASYITVANGDSFAAWVKTEGGDGTCNTYLTLTYADGSSTQSNIVHQAADWTQLVINIGAGDDGKMIYGWDAAVYRNMRGFVLTGENNSNTTYRVFVDDIGWGAQLGGPGSYRDTGIFLEKRDRETLSLLDEYFLTTATLEDLQDKVFIAYPHVPPDGSSCIVYGRFGGSSGGTSTEEFVLDGSMITWGAGIAVHASFPGNAVNNVLAEASWHTDTSINDGNSWVKLNLGTPQELVEWKQYVTASQVGWSRHWNIQYSDNDSTWTTAAALTEVGTVGYHTISWASVGSHRYWRAILTDASAYPGPWRGELKVSAVSTLPAAGATQVSITTDAGENFSVIENTWGTDYCCALRVDALNNCHTIRASGIMTSGNFGAWYYTSSGVVASGLTQTMELPFIVNQGAMDIDADYSVAIGSALPSGGIGSGVAVLEIEPPYITYSNITYDYPIAGSITGVSYILGE